jgi:hypothetical protein
MKTPKLRGASGPVSLSIAHLQLQRAKVVLATERWRALGEGIRLVRVVVAVGAALWVAYALGDVAPIIKELLAQVLM